MNKFYAVYVNDDCVRLIAVYSNKEAAEQEAKFEDGWVKEYEIKDHFKPPTWFLEPRN